MVIAHKYVWMYLSRRVQRYADTVSRDHGGIRFSPGPRSLHCTGRPTKKFPAGCRCCSGGQLFSVLVSVARIAAVPLPAAAAADDDDDDDDHLPPTQLSVGIRSNTMKIKALSRSIEAYQPAGANVPKQPRNLVSTG